MAFLHFILSSSSSLTQVQDEGRTKVRETLTPATAQSALQRILPFPCKNQYTVVVLVPQISWVRALKSRLPPRLRDLSQDAMVGDSAPIFPSSNPPHPS